VVDGVRSRGQAWGVDVEVERVGVLRSILRDKVMSIRQWSGGGYEFCCVRCIETVNMGFVDGGAAREWRCTSSEEGRSHEDASILRQLLSSNVMGLQAFCSRRIVWKNIRSIGSVVRSL
jgi:hypothetical protein